MRPRNIVLLAVLGLGLPSAALAQGAIAGTVRDTSSAVLPGVTVEASSVALIEKARTVVTDGTGQYQIINLPPGQYPLTFTLPGFNTVRREAVDVSTVAVATINVEMRVGAVEETVTVTGESQIVDVQSANRGVVMRSEVVNQLPATRGYAALVQLLPSITGANQVQVTPTIQMFSSHGGRTNEGRLQLDGLSIGASVNGAGVGLYMPDTSGAEEIAVSLSGGLGEAEMGGAVMNIVPKTGGNTFSGSGFFSIAGPWSQGENLDDRLRGFGLTDPPEIHGTGTTACRWVVPSSGIDCGSSGHIVTSVSTARWPGCTRTGTQALADKWLYDRDDQIKVRDASARTAASMRLTAQLTGRNKVSVFYDHQLWCDGSAMIRTADNCRPAGSNWVANGTPTVSPEAASGPDGPASGYADTNLRVVHATWTSPVTDVLLLEAGLSSVRNRGGIDAPPGMVDLIPVTEQSSLNGMPAGLTYRGLRRWLTNWQNPNTWKAAMSYVTGSHNMKFGYQGAHHVFEQRDFRNSDRLTYQFNNGVPNRLTMDIGNWTVSDRVSYHAVYAQDQWRRDRLTLQAAVRFDHAYSYAPAEHNGWASGDRFHSEPLTFEKTFSVKGYNDLTPRRGRGLRPLRRRADILQGERGEVSRKRQCLGQLHDQQSGADHPLSAHDQPRLERYRSGLPTRL